MNNHPSTPPREPHISRFPLFSGVTFSVSVIPEHLSNSPICRIAVTMEHSGKTRKKFYRIITVSPRLVIIQNNWRPAVCPIQEIHILCDYSHNMWDHITSQLLDTAPMILFCYELTRRADHLRKFYQDFQGFITCNVYCSYHVLEKEKQKVITVYGCMMHLCRRFANSLALLNKTGLSEGEIRQIPKAQALLLIGKIFYDADEALKNLSAEERRNTV